MKIIKKDWNEWSRVRQNIYKDPQKLAVMRYMFGCNVYEVDGGYFVENKYKSEDSIIYIPESKSLTEIAREYF